MRWTIREKIRETPDTMTLRFQPEKRVVFKAGQFFLLSDVVKGIEDCRAYSASSSPSREYVDITVKLVRDPWFSKHLHSLQVGAEIDVKGPMGDFFLHVEWRGPVLLIGAGSGIAPLRSMIQYISDNHLNNEATLVYSARTTDQLIFANELTELDAEKKIRLDINLTQEHSKEFVYGRITSKTLKKYVKKNSQIYICGPPVMVSGTVRMLKRLGVPDPYIYQEKF